MKRISSIKYLFSAAFLFASFGAIAGNDLSGKWQCSGYDPVTKEQVSTTVDFKKIGANRYSFKDWVDVKSGKKLSGDIVQNKNHDENFAISFWSDDKPGYIGFGVYQINTDGTLAGQRSSKASELVSEELCNKM